MGFLNPNPFSLKEKPVKLFKSTFSLKLFFSELVLLLKNIFKTNFYYQNKNHGIFKSKSFSLKQKPHETF